jgi:hypothetical protein
MFIWEDLGVNKSMENLYTVKKVHDFSVPSRDVTNSPWPGFTV